MPATRRALLTGRRSPEQARVTITDRCLARRAVHCQSCGDACPEQAIRFALRLGGPPLPAIAADKCTGCGDCVAVCPASALILAPEMPRA